MTDLSYRDRPPDVDVPRGDGTVNLSVGSWVVFWGATRIRAWHLNPDPGGAAGGAGGEQRCGHGDGYICSRCACGGTFPCSGIDCS